MVFENPNIDWYVAKSKSNALLPRCPFASVESCPRFYQSLSLLGNAGSTNIPKKDDDKLLKKWKTSPFWPVTDEQMTSQSRSNDECKTFSNFCPEISYERFRIFASDLCRYSDEIDQCHARSQLLEMNAPRNDWRWLWAYIKPLHYSECLLYSLLSGSRKDGRDIHEDIFQIKPGIYGISIDLRKLWRKLMDMTRAFISAIR